MLLAVKQLIDLLYITMTHGRMDRQTDGLTDGLTVRVLEKTYIVRYIKISALSFVMYVVMGHVMCVT